jgi:putative flavoprotein involved in K+ transport
MAAFYDVLVIGGGQAGLATGYHLQRAGLSFAILERAPEPGGSWLSYYDSLKLFSPAGRSSRVG